uniref:Glutamine amidotransferase, class I n=1 Tax=Chlorobium chlorochromatii (strain CaD3) TaxID=340177 RepID=Q3AS85_CHLCH
MPDPALLLIKNAPHEGAGLLENVLHERTISYHTVELTEGQAIPNPRNFSGVVVFGGPQSVNDATPSMQAELRALEQILADEIPYLGICLGMQALVNAAGGVVLPCPIREVGFYDNNSKPYTVTLTEAGKNDPLFANLDHTFRVFQLHGETVEMPASGVTLLGYGSQCPIQAVRAGDCAYGLQCHFELTSDMFAYWCQFDTDLKRMDQAMLQQHFAEIQQTYVATGKTLLTNFLTIAHL